MNVDSGVASSAYLSLDQGMIMAAIGNELAGDMLRRAFADEGTERTLRPVIGAEEFGARPRGCTIRGTRRADRIRGTQRADVICAGGGNDRVDGRGGEDVIYGDAGDDRLAGGAAATMRFTAATGTTGCVAAAATTSDPPARASECALAVA